MDPQINQSYLHIYKGSQNGNSLSIQLLSPSPDSPQQSKSCYTIVDKKTPTLCNVQYETWTEVCSNLVRRHLRQHVKWEVRNVALRFFRFSPFTAKSNQSATKEGKSQTGSQMIHHLWIVFFGLKTNELCNPFMKFGAFWCHSTRGCKY